MTTEPRKHLRALAVGAPLVFGCCAWLAAIGGRFGDTVATVVIGATVILVGLAFSYAVGYSILDWRSSNDD